MPELEPRIFSFNSPHGACERCTGLGSQMEIDPDLVVPDPSLSIAEGALAPWATSSSNYYEQITEAIAEASRLAAPVLRDFYTERDVVMEERRMRIDNAPYGNGFLMLDLIYVLTGGGPGNAATEDRFHEPQVARGYEVRVPDVRQIVDHGDLGPRRLPGDEAGPEQRIRSTHEAVYRGPEPEHAQPALQALRDAHGAEADVGPEP